MAATDGAFALWSSSGVITWGHAEEGGDSSKVQDQLKAVQDIQARGQFLISSFHPSSPLIQSPGLQVPVIYELCFSMIKSEQIGSLLVHVDLDCPPRTPARPYR